MMFTECITKAKEQDKLFKQTSDKRWMYIDMVGSIRYKDTSDRVCLFWDNYSADNWELEPGKVKKTGWMNIYVWADTDDRQGDRIWPTKEKALAAGEDSVDTVQVTWEDRGDA